MASRHKGTYFLAAYELHSRMLMKFTFHYSCQTAGESSQKENKMKLQQRERLVVGMRKNRLLKKYLVFFVVVLNCCEICADEKKSNLSAIDCK